MKKPLWQGLLLALMCLGPFLVPAMAQKGEVPVNIAHGKKVMVSPPANSGDSGNKTELLTDGKLVNGEETKEDTRALWVQAGTTGWSNMNPACIMIDLETVQPISGFSYHTAAGAADVTWPKNIFVAVSDDGKQWRYVGDLVALSARHGAAPEGGYHEHTFSTHDIKAKGRFVAFGITSALYIFTDEVAVFAGDASWPEESLTGTSFENQPPDILDYMRSLMVRERIAYRSTEDGRAIRGLIEQSKLADVKKVGLLQKLARVEKLADVTSLPTNLIEFRTILPMNDKQRQLLALHGEFLAEVGHKPLSVWTQHRYAWLPLLAQPPKNTKAQIDFSMLGNQIRSQSLLLTNASAQPRQVSFKFDRGLPTARAGAVRNGAVQIDAVQWTDTYDGIVVPDALLPVTREGENYKLEIPAGMTRKLWLTLDSSKLPPGTYRSALLLDDNGKKTRVPFICRISNVAMPRPRLSLGMWDESDRVEQGSGYSITPRNYRAALELMRSHYVDTAFGLRATLPWPAAADFDADGNLTKELDFSRFDKWIQDWPHARRFFSFLVAGDTFAEAKMDTPEFETRLGSWSKAVAAHVRKRGMEPKQLGFMIVDEVRTLEQNATLKAWAGAINKAVPEFVIFANPIWARPDQLADQEPITRSDLLCPNLPLYYRGGEAVEKYYAKLREQGRELWFYQCAGPVRLFDPQRYYRYQAWHVYSIGGTGQGFWAFGDSGSPSSWNDYMGAHYNYAPEFIDPESVTNSVHWDAVREGVQDFEELSMLRDSIATTKNANLRKVAQQVLDDAVKTVTGSWKDDQSRGMTWLPEHYRWQSDEFDANLADAQLVKVRAMLERLQ